MALPVAIIGISAEFPSGTTSNKNLDHDAFFEFLLNKGQAYEIIPSERFNIDSWKGLYAGQVITDTGAFLKDVSSFDHLEFGITAADAKNMSLSTRKLIEHSFLALLDSGIDYRGRNIGCFASGVSFDLTNITEPDELDARGSFAGYPYMISNKVSYHLDLRGPSVPTDTACSSTLTAMHLAVQSVRSGECEAAVVGGCQLNYRLIDFIQYSQGGILSPDGKCKPFDSSADGFGRGEGVCAVVIKPLEDAIRDGDPIYASIVGTGINSSGGIAPVSAPVAMAQEDAMRRAYVKTGRRPSDVDYIELHATGTAVGDPTEANWVGKAFKHGDGGEVLIGSVKGNIGHLEITAFLASLSKVCSIFRTGLVPPNVNLDNPNPAIQWDEYRLRVPTETRKLQPKSSSGKLLISMTSSGIGGVNGHVVLESPPERNVSVTEGRRTEPILICLGGLSPRSATEVASDVQNLIAKNEFSEHTATIYGRRSRQMTWRTYSVYHPTKMFTKFPDPVLVPRSKPPLVFVFSGQGPQHINMGRLLYQRYPAFRQTIQKLDSVHKNLTGYYLTKDIGLFHSEGASVTLPDIWPIAITLPALCMIQIATFELLQTFGIKPDAVIGHSAGEAAMFYASGAASLELAVEISIARGLAMAELENEDGAMAAVNCSNMEANMIRNEVCGLNEGGSNILDIACHNSQTAFVFSGTRSLVERAVELAKSRGLFTRIIRTRIPVHSGLMDICHKKYQELVLAVFRRYFANTSHTLYPKISTYSCLNGEQWLGPFTPDYIWQTARHPVLFSQGIFSILRDMPTASFLEISPHPVLTSYISDLVGTGDNTVIPCLKRAKEKSESEELFTFLSALGKITNLGYNISSVASVHGFDAANFSVRVPPYPFAKKEIEFFSRSSSIITRHLSSGRRPLYDPCNELRLNSLTHPDIAAHIIRGEAIMPAAGYIEMAFESGARHLWNIEFRSIMPFPRDSYLFVNFLRSGPYWQVISRPSDQRLSKHMVPRLHAEGYLSESSPSTLLRQISPLREIVDRCKKINVHKFYENLRYFAGYGPVFQRVQSCYLNDEEALVKVKAWVDDIPNINRYTIHPAVLDASFHIMVSPSFTGNSDRTGYYLPSGVKAVNLHRPNFFKENRPQAIYSYVKLVSWEPDHIDYDLSLLDIDGILICSMQGFRVSRHNIEEIQPSRECFDLVHRPIEHPSVPNVNIYLEDNKQLHVENSSPIIVPFKHDCVLVLQRTISELKKSKSKSARLWIEATLGLGGFAAQGFVRSLSREIAGVDIFLALFHPTWGEQDRKVIIAGISALENLEHEVTVDAEGILRCPRLVPLAIPEEAYPNAEDLWKWDDEKHSLNIIHSPTYQLGELLVRFSSITTVTAGGYRGFLGTVIRSVVDGISTGVAVVGITSSETFANHGVIPDGHFIIVSQSENQDTLCDVLLPIVVIRFAVGSRSLQDSRYRGRRIVYIGSESAIDKQIIHLLDSLGMEVLSVLQTQLQRLSFETVHSDIIISSTTDKNEIQAIKQLSHGKMPVFFFNDEFTGIRRMIHTDPWSVREAIQTILPIVTSLPKCDLISVDPMALIPEQPPQIHRDLFASSKSYMLIGGIGSLGLQVALWMYQNGARHLVLSSRRGASSLQVRRDVMAQRILHYLETRPDLHIQLEACDATSEQEVASLINRIQIPIAGCLLMSVVLSDRLFMSHTDETYFVPFSPKLGAFEALNYVIDVKSLDFLVSFSSAAIFGNPGQTNYASANTQLEGVLSSYPNAFSLVCPAIIDSITISHGDNLLPDTRYQNWIPWAMTSKQICEHLGAGIRKLASGPFTNYIPDFDWNHVQRHFGKSPMYDSLVTTVDDAVGVVLVDSEKRIVEMVVKHLDMAIEDLASNVPLTSYGLDSLSAGRLAYALKPIVSVTQLQLLGDMTLQDLQKLAAESSNHDDDELSPALRRGFDWVGLNRPGETLLKLVEGDENPLILIHGGTGGIIAFIPLQDRFKTALWAVQSTPDAPKDSIRAIASHYCAKIKEERPVGPYRIVGYCASSILAFEIVRLLEQNGDRVSQFVVLDHFPSLFISPLFPLDDESLESGKPSEALMQTAFLSLCNCYHRDPANGRKRLVTELLYTSKGAKGRPLIEYTYQYFQDIVTACLKFILEIGGPEQRYNSSNLHLLQERFKEWMSSISAPVTVVVATRGIGAELLTEDGWQGFGAKDIIPNVEVVEIPYGHFDMFENEELVNILEKDSLGM